MSAPNLTYQTIQDIKTFFHAQLTTNSLTNKWKGAIKAKMNPWSYFGYFGFISSQYAPLVHRLYSGMKDIHITL